MSTGGRLLESLAIGVKMQRITQDNLTIITKFLTEKSGIDFQLEYSNGGVKLTRCNQSINVTNRMTKGQLYSHLRAMTDLVELMNETIT